MLGSLARSLSAGYGVSCQPATPTQAVLTGESTELSIPGTGLHSSNATSKGPFTAAKADSLPVICKIVISFTEMCDEKDNSLIIKHQIKKKNGPYSVQS